jgi:hypothetical protein
MQTEADSDEVYAQIMLQPEADVSLSVLIITNMQMVHMILQFTILWHILFLCWSLLSMLCFIFFYI